MSPGPGRHGDPDVGVLGAVGMASVAPSPAGAATSATYQTTVTEPGPLAGNFAQTAGGDGWAVALTATQVFAVAHHQNTLMVACHNQSDASQCWSTATKTVTNGTADFATSPGPGLYLNQSTGKLYVYVTDLATNTAGVACIDTTKPASETGAQMFCGFTALSGVGDAPTYFGQFGTYAGIVRRPRSVPTGTPSTRHPWKVSAPGPTGPRTPSCASASRRSVHARPRPTRCRSAASPSTPSSIRPTSRPSARTSSSRWPAPSRRARPTRWGASTPRRGHPAPGPGRSPRRSSAVRPCSSVRRSPSSTDPGRRPACCLPMANNPCYSLSGSVISTPAHMPATIGANNVLNGPAVVNASLTASTSRTG